MTALDHAVDRAADETQAASERPGGEDGLEGKLAAEKTCGPNPFLVVGAALLAGILLAKWIDWRGHAHPRW